MMSNSPRKDEFRQYLETVIERDIKISELSIWDYFRLVGADEEFKKHLEKSSSLLSLKGRKVGIGGLKEDFLSFTLPLTSSIKGHKAGNIIMANLYYNLGKDYNKMLEFMHALLKVEADIIPVTIGKAYIRAVL